MLFGDLIELYNIPSSNPFWILLLTNDKHVFVEWIVLNLDSDNLFSNENYFTTHQEQLTTTKKNCNNMKSPTLASHMKTPHTRMSNSKHNFLTE